MEFKDEEDFKKSGFAENGPYYAWFKEVEKLENNADSKLLLQKGVVAGELKSLGMEYVNSKGQETEVTRSFNEIFLDVISTNAEKEKESLHESTAAKRWYEGGSLHKADGKIWEKASDQNKLATCADFIMTIAQNNGEEPSVHSADFKFTSETLKKCIDKFYDLPENHNLNVSKAAIACMSK